MWNYRPIGRWIREDVKRMIFGPIEAYGWLNYKDSLNCMICHLFFSMLLSHKRRKVFVTVQSNAGSFHVADLVRSSEGKSV
jgi:hypothetical protein